MTANAPCLRETTHTRRNVRYCFVTTGEDAFRVRGALINMPLVSGRYGVLPCRRAPARVAGRCVLPAGERRVKKLTFGTFVRYPRRILAGWNTVSESLPTPADENIGGTVSPGMEPGKRDDERWSVAGDGEAG